MPAFESTMIIDESFPEAAPEPAADEPPDLEDATPPKAAAPAKPVSDAELEAAEEKLAEEAAAAAAAPPAAAPAAPPPAPEPPPLRSAFRARLEAEAARRAAEGAPNGSAAALAAAAFERQAARALEEERRERTRQALQEDPQGYLQQHGLSYADLTRRVMEGQQPHVARLERQIEEMRAWQLAQQEQMARSQAELQRQREIDELRTALSANPEYELVSAYDAWPYVAEAMEAHFQQTGQVMDENAAAKQVERRLTETVSKALETRKIAAALAARTVKSKGEIPAAAPATTLTNQHAAEPPTRAAPAAESRDQVRARAAAKLKFLT